MEDHIELYYFQANLVEPSICLMLALGRYVFSYLEIFSNRSKLFLESN